MSKADAQRAMREAKFAARNRGPGREATAAAGKPPVPAVGAPAAKPDAPPQAAAPAGQLCGHKSMNGRACTRAAGHAEKSHRYS